MGISPIVMGIFWDIVVISIHIFMKASDFFGDFAFLK
jgi:hypothetical protein